MSLKEIQKVKTNKYFTRWDFIVYFLFLFAVGVAVCFLMFGRREEKPDYLKICYRNETIGLYGFEKDEWTVKEGYEGYFKIEETSSDVLTVFIYPTDESYNVLKIKKTERQADMEDGNCSRSKDCTYMHIKRAGQNIVCVPHNLVIEGVSKTDGNDDIIIG